jgi:demethoxyubiquinone hydroxylase (CLK1/Coq7/Cat5 family)
MTKKKTVSASDVEEQQADEEAPEAAEEPKRKRGDLVRVRFSGEMGLLAGKAVYNGEVHRVRYWQYLRARETGGEAYQLVEE